MDYIITFIDGEQFLDASYEKYCWRVDVVKIEERRTSKVIYEK